MPTAVLEAYNTLSLEAQQEVEHLIYFLVAQQKKQNDAKKNNSSVLDSFVGKCNSWKGEDALVYQNNLRAEERV